VPILGGKPWECFEPFREHIAKIVGATLSRRVQVRLEGPRGGDTVYMRFETGETRSTLRLNTILGPIDFYLRQELLAEPHTLRGYRLRTRRYWYHLLQADEIKPFLRWEYVSREHEQGRGTLHCRNHLHFSQQIQFGESAIDLHHAHVPTGWVTIEEVIRFLIHELEAVPPCGDRWDKVLTTGDDRFYQEFTSKRD